MLKKLMPFWIYFVLIAIGNAAFRFFPILYMFILLALPMLVIIVPLWIMIVYLIGKEVQHRRESNHIVSRIAVAFFCSLAILMIFPVERGLKELIDWGYIDFDFFTDFPWWCSLAVHFLSF